MSRVIWIVLDSVGMGEAFDAKDFGDVGANTIGHIMEKYPDLKIDNLRKIGYGNIDGIKGVLPVEKPLGAYGSLKEISAGKDTTTGHWEMAGIYTKNPFPTFPSGFSKEIIDKFVEKCGIPGILGNCVASGTVIINELGDEHSKSKKPIVYTSADSVFQIACDESIYPPEKLYEMCGIARDILKGENGVARVIARPFVKQDDTYVRTSNRRDFSLKPDENNMLSIIKNAGKEVYGIGKIEDIFAGVGLTRAVHTKSNEDGMDKTIEALDIVKDGLIFTNLVEFDSTWGHRRDVSGYAKGLEAFDLRLLELMNKIGSFEGKYSEDYIVITADHGCDPTFKGTDHTRELVPFLIYGNMIKPDVNLGLGETFADSGQTVLDLLRVNENLKIGNSRFDEVYKASIINNH